MARIQQDQFIDEDEEEEVCPLCVEEFDLGDRYFKPCPCGYQICQFCYNNIKTTMNGLCPACRRPYDDKPYSFKNVTQEELLQHEKAKAAQQKKRAAAKAKEIQKREADNLSRKHLAGLRVRQRNLVYVTGMRPKIQGDRVAELLRGKEYFGQYGEIVKVVVSKSKEQAPSQSVGIYVTFARKEDAAACIQAINEQNYEGDGKIRAQHGTTKYCSAYLRGESCNNRNCMFLHEPGESAESFTRQDLSNMNAYQTQQPSAPGEDPPPQPPPQHAQPVAAAVQPDAAPSSPGNSALPAGAGWAARRGSRGTSTDVESPMVSNAVPAKDKSRITADDAKSRSSKDTSSISSPSRPASAASTSKKKSKRSPERAALDKLVRTAFDSNMRFQFSMVGLSDEDIKLFELLPPLWDPQGGAKRRLMKEREAEDLRKIQEAKEAALASAATQAQRPSESQSQAQSEDQAEAAGMGGSLQLGGEPEERPSDRINPSASLGNAFANQSAIQPPGFGPLGGSLGLGGVGGPQGFGSGIGLGGGLGLDNDLANLSLRGASLTPNQHGGHGQQQHSQNLLRQFQTAGMGQQQHQQNQIGSSMAGHGHGRQPSRFSFNETGGIKAGAGLQGQPIGLNQKIGGAGFGGQTQQQAPFYSGVQGPPPGLKTTGTPPVNGSGMGMFGQGHGFTSAYAGVGAPQDPRQQKREFMFPNAASLSTHNSSAASTPAPGMGMYGQPDGAGGQGGQKKSKKGKKHRHGNTSSSGGGDVGGQDPSILQARPYGGGAPGLNGGMGGYGQGQQQMGGYGGYGRQW